MTRKQALKILADCGFQLLDEPTPNWAGVYTESIYPVGKFSIHGECRGQCCTGVGKAEFWSEAAREAMDLRDTLTACTDPDCEMHSDEAMAEAVDFYNGGLTT
jgi:hypothetical protein